jgi:hypothetical protein
MKAAGAVYALSMECADCNSSKCGASPHRPLGMGVVHEAGVRGERRRRPSAIWLRFRLSL